MLDFYRTSKLQVACCKLSEAKPSEIPPNVELQVCDQLLTADRLPEDLQA